MRFIISSFATAAALLLAGTAHAQSAQDMEYRVIGSSRDSAALVSVNVTGPQQERRLTNLMMAAEAGPSGADNFVSDIVVNCTAGSIQYPKTSVYAGDTFIVEMPFNEEWRVPGENTMDGAVVRYACKGELGSDPATVKGLSAARAKGRDAMLAY